MNNDLFEAELHITTSGSAYNEQQEELVLTVPTEEWETLSAMYSADIYSESKSSIPGVRTAIYKGRTYTSFATCYGGSRGNSVISAWELIPSSIYSGPTFTKETKVGYDYFGVLVQKQGLQLVCSRPTNIVMGLPAGKPVSLNAAKELNAEHRAWGWRAHRYSDIKDDQLQWFFLNGHPVVRYQDADDEGDFLQMLFFMHNGKIIEKCLPNHITALTPACEDLFQVPQVAESFKYTQPFQEQGLLF